MKLPNKNEIRKPTKTISGITPVAVMLPPRKCLHGTCIYCPSLDVTQSYTPKSPVVMRALQVNYNAYEQVKARIKAFSVMNHPTEKIELIIMGGTFLEYPEKFQYKFIKDCYDALNEKKSENLGEAQKLNETAEHRCVALCIETRPDVCVKYIKRLREFGCTRIELGVQMPDDEIYKIVKRGHNVKDVIEATKELKNAGFKIGYHIMPGLPGSNLKNDLQLFRRLFKDETFKPDQIKIYPCQVIKGAELENEYWKGRYKTYTKEELEELLEKMLKLTPRYCRVMRIMREIPPEYLISGTTRIDLRKDIEAELRKKNSKINEIRYREVGFNPTHSSKSQMREVGFNNEKNKKGSNGMEPNRPTLNDNYNKSKYLNVSSDEFRKRIDDLKLKITKYKASGGDEYFLEIVNKEDILFGLLRLRIFDYDKDNLSADADIDKKLLMKEPLSDYSTNYSKKSRANADKRAISQNKQAIIRELHVYGQALRLGEIGKTDKNAVQHRGFGKWLMNEAEKIVKKEKVGKIAVISGVGVRKYYQKLGYKLEESYMVKAI